MSDQEDFPTRNGRRPRGKGRLSGGSGNIDISASLDEFIGNACALLEEPLAISPDPEPEPVAVAEPDPIAERMAQIEEALARAANRVAALTEAPPPPRPRRRLGVSAVSMAIGAFVAGLVLLVGYGRSQGERQVSAAPAQAPAPAAVTAAPIPAPAAVSAVPVPAPVAVTPPPPVASARPAPASTPRKPVPHKAARRPAPKSSGGIVDPFAN